MPVVQMDYDPSNRHELMFAAVSEAMTQQFLITNQTLLAEGHALNRPQLQRFIAMLMRSFATAKESAWVVEQEYARLMAEAADAVAEEEKGEPNELEHLADLKEKFSRGPQP